MYLMKISFGSLVEHAKLSLKKMKKFDYVLLLSAFLLLAIGITAVYSATYTRTTSFYQKQILWAIIGTGMFFTFSNIDYRIYSRYSKLIYIFNVVFLISVFIFGSKDILNFIVSAGTIGKNGISLSSPTPNKP